MTLRLVQTTATLRDGTSVKVMVEKGAPSPTATRLMLMKAAPEMLGALRRVPEPPVGLMDMTPNELAEWGTAYMDWWRDVRGKAIAAAEGM